MDSYWMRQFMIVVIHERLNHYGLLTRVGWGGTSGILETMCNKI